MNGTCFLCGSYETVERHHIFGGALRPKADKLGLTVMLCRGCHQYDADSAHQRRETREYLRKFGQRRAMAEQGWSVGDFVREFGKNYLDEDELELMDETPRENNSFQLIDGGALPW